MRTEFNKVNLTGAKFINIKLTDVKLTMSDLRKTIFDLCLFKGVDFTYSDLRGVNFEGQSFIGVRFDKAALNDAVFKGSTLENVSFNSTFALTNKYYRGIKTIRFDGAKMDKLTYAGLKELRVHSVKCYFYLGANSLSGAGERLHHRRRDILTRTVLFP